MRAERLTQAAGQCRRREGRVGRQLLVGEAEEELLPIGQMGLPYVDAAVGEDTPDDLDRPGPLGAAGQQLATDGVADIVGEQGEAADAQLVHEGGHHVGLQGQGVGKIGFGREPVTEPVEEKEATSVAQRVEHGGEVERRRGEAVKSKRGSCASSPIDGASIVKTRWPHRSR